MHTNSLSSEKERHLCPVSNQQWDQGASAVTKQLYFYLLHKITNCPTGPETARSGNTVHVWSNPCKAVVPRVLLACRLGEPHIVTNDPNCRNRFWYWGSLLTADAAVQSEWVLGLFLSYLTRFSGSLLARNKYIPVKCNESVMSKYNPSPGETPCIHLVCGSRRQAKKEIY